MKRKNLKFIQGVDFDLIEKISPITELSICLYLMILVKRFQTP